MNSKLLSVLAAASFLSLSLPLHSQTIDNGSFEIDFGLPEDMNVWGDKGFAFGETYQVAAGKPHVKRARTDDRVLLINVPPNTWNGIWQEIPWPGESLFSWEAYCRIEGGNLPNETDTFMKVEFYDDNEQKIGEKEGEHYSEKTYHRWVQSVVSGTTPENTSIIRFVIIAGKNNSTEPVLNQIYWDDAKIVE